MSINLKIIKINKFLEKQKNKMTQIGNLNGSKFLNIFNWNVQRTIHSHGKNNLEPSFTVHMEFIPDGCRAFMRKKFHSLEDVLWHKRGKDFLDNIYIYVCM